MDTRYGSMTRSEVLLFRKKVIDDVLAHAEWTPAEALGYMRKELRITFRVATSSAAKKSRHKGRDAKSPAKCP